MLRRLAVPILLVSIILIGCDETLVDLESEPLSTEVTLRLSSEALILAPGESTTLELTLVDKQGNEVSVRGKPKWSSSNNEVAVVDEDGVVTGKAEGDAIIHVRSGPGEASTSVQVRETEESAPEIVEVRIEPEAVVFDAVGQETQLEATVIDETGTEVADPGITWSSLDPSVATVDRMGKVLARAVGVALITASTGAVADTAVVETVQNISALSITPESATVAVADTVRFVATALDSNGDGVEGVVFAWSTSDSRIASIDDAGLLTGRTTGDVTVTVATAQKSATARLTVTQEEVEDPVDDPAEEPVDENAPSTWIYPGDDIQAKVDAHGSGASFLIKAGVHRLQEITPRSGQEFVGEEGAILNGAKVLTGWTREGGIWWTSDRDGGRRPNTSGSCQSGYPRCQYAEDLFIDDRPQRHVASVSDVTAGTWHFDYDNGRVYVGSDPSGRTVERGLADRAFDGSASNVRIRNLVIEKYATRFQEGAIHGNESDGWIVEDNVVRLNHGVGIMIGNRMQVLANKIVSNGQLGLGGIGDDVLVEGNELAYNNYAGVSTGWEAGATKFVKTRNLIVRRNHVHNNYGKALWTDIDNIYTLYEENVVEDNGHQGIFHEISYDAIIRNNTIRRNGFERADSWVRAAGIFIANSPNVEIYGNILEDNYHGITGVQQPRGEGRHGPYLLRNLWVHDNEVRMSRGLNGVARDDGDEDVFSATGNNRFDRNTYIVSDTDKSWFAWDNGGRSWDSWRAYNHDVNGKITSR